MTRLPMVAFLGLVLASPALADQNASQDGRRAECTQQLERNQHYTKRGEFLDFCLAHKDPEVQRYWSCASRADKSNLGTDRRRSFLEWCVQSENYADAQANRFSYCDARASNKDLKGKDREKFVNGCVDRGAANDDDQWERYQACLTRADELKLARDDRQNFVNWCVDRGN
jgi:hypothetical protein